MRISIENFFDGTRRNVVPLVHFNLKAVTDAITTLHKNNSIKEASLRAHIWNNASVLRVRATCAEPRRFTVGPPPFSCVRNLVFDHDSVTVDVCLGACVHTRFFFRFRTWPILIRLSDI